jgi:hypothetical protein
MRDPEKLRAEANRITVDHRPGDGPQDVCKCGKKWPCKEGLKAQKLYRKARKLETDNH